MTQSNAELDVLLQKATNIKFEHERQMREINEKIEYLRMQEKGFELENVKALVAKYVITPEEIFGVDVLRAKYAPVPSYQNHAMQMSAVKEKSTRGAVASKYRGFNGETWSGRGLTPRWLAMQLASGYKKDDFLIDKKTDAIVDEIVAVAENAA